MKRNRMIKKVVQYKNIELYTESFGDFNNPAILLIAGAHAPSVFWPNFFCQKLVEAGYFVIRYDHRDIGYSTHFPVTKNSSKPIYDLNDLTNDAIAILDDYQISRSNIIGHSMGGHIVQYLTAFYPERILHAVSMSVSVVVPTHKHPQYDAIMRELLKNKPTGDFEKDWNKGWLKSMKLLNGSNDEFDEEMARMYVKTIYERNRNDLNPAWNQIAAQQTKLPILDKLPSDMLLICGSDDVFVPYEDIKELSTRFKIKILNGVGHMFFNKKIWDRIAQIILHYFLF